MLFRREVQTSFSFHTNWGKIFDDGGVGNTVVGIVVDSYSRRGNSANTHNLNSTNQVYCKESLYNGIISFDNDYLAILQEALSEVKDNEAHNQKNSYCHINNINIYFYYSCIKQQAVI